MADPTDVVNFTCGKLVHVVYMLEVGFYILVGVDCIGDGCSFCERAKLGLVAKVAAVDRNAGVIRYGR